MAKVPDRWMDKWSGIEAVRVTDGKGAGVAARDAARAGVPLTCHPVNDLVVLTNLKWEPAHTIPSVCLLLVCFFTAKTVIQPIPDP
jgi:hypothetical protein